jgi:hypothetical protein
MANKVPVKANYTNGNVTSLGEFVSGDTFDVSYIADGTITAAKLAADTATQAELDTVSTVASAALPKAGGTMTGNLVMGANLVDGIDISARDAILTSTTTTAAAALPKAGGAMTGNTTRADNVVSYWGTGNDLYLTHNGTNSQIRNQTGRLELLSDGSIIMQDSGANETFAIFNDNGAVTLNYDNSTKIATTTNGVTVTGAAVGTLTTDNDGSFALSASNHFKCTPSGNFTLTFTSIVSQSGNILLVNSGGHTVSAHANTKVDANFLSTISAAGTYLLAYFSDGTNVYMTNSAIYT